MNWQNMKQLAMLKSQGRWHITYPGNAEKAQPAFIKVGRHEISVDAREDFSDPYPDACFIVTVANNWSKIEAVIDAALAKGCDEWYMADLNEALAALEKE